MYLVLLLERVAALLPVGLDDGDDGLLVVDDPLGLVLGDGHLAEGAVLVELDLHGGGEVASGLSRDRLRKKDVEWKSCLKSCSTFLVLPEAEATEGSSSC